MSRSSDLSSKASPSLPTVVPSPPSLVEPPPVPSCCPKALSPSFLALGFVQCTRSNPNPSPQWPPLSLPELSQQPALSPSHRLACALCPCLTLAQAQISAPVSPSDSSGGLLCLSLLSPHGTEHDLQYYVCY